MRILQGQVTKSDFPSPSTERFTSSNSENSKGTRIAKNNARSGRCPCPGSYGRAQGSLAVELRYQCKAHKHVEPSAQPTAARSAMGTPRCKRLCQGTA